MCGAALILWLGAKNVLGTGWTNWNIAAFATFLSCFTKMALKSSSAAKLFNAVQKAQVSWVRIKPLMKEYVEQHTASSLDFSKPAGLTVSDLSLRRSGGETILREISFSAGPGQIIGVTGPVACGKSTLGKVFTGELPYEGSIRVGARELSALSGYERSRLISYMGHVKPIVAVSFSVGLSMPQIQSVLKTLPLVGAGEINDGGGAAVNRRPAASLKVVGSRGVAHVQIKVGVCVNEAREQKLTGDVYGPIRLARQAPPNFNNFLAFDQDVGPAASGAGDHGSALEQCFHVRNLAPRHVGQAGVVALRAQGNLDGLQHVEALIYSLDIDERKWIQQIAGAVLCSQYRLFVRIDLSHNTARLYNAHTGRFLKEHGCPPETIERYICQHCSDADREEFLKKVSLSEVERQLQNSNEYVVYSNLKLNGRQMRAKCVFFWMDREQRTVCFALADITDAAVKEQSRTEELSRALSAAEEASRTKSEFLSRMSHGRMG